MVQSLRAVQKPVWIVSQSNVAVKVGLSSSPVKSNGSAKNIASKLGKYGFREFKLLVSHEFHFDWNEHLYEELESSIIRSDEYANLVPASVERLLDGSRVILCTISMLSNTKMLQAGFPKVVPVENLLVDEASQIDVGNYLHIAHAFRHTLRKLVFVGDDQQHRLPTPICAFVSFHMYEGKLQSVHPITTSLSCKFFDVHLGAEVQVGRSWTNQSEAETCITLAQMLCDMGKTDFRIITPYDAQRKVLEDRLKATDLRWEDTVFCVDSFQGNEADYIIVSLVRTKKPGFITNARRSNVMLTRCKKGMYICTNRAFLKTPAAQDTLVGKMAKEWGGNGWIRMADVVDGRI
ncbi:hypothetical protein AURDEDRAFT_76602 [Auricularia subglabra TFB-10046 SS5]|uniref:DNA2/NAM7 helicase-like C-terminal domain-containing protein n=1 Tax=Auricularia subglabra (strain TFB-10046 / SS5) TaxID=717982 RepID=J0D554_AURST|nr:hypothetical protein AURDEDRAFT_76602 [Auricularia subglabra TFB-10046 SS5]